MGWYVVAQRRISTAEEGSRVPVPHFRGDEVWLSQEDADRLGPAVRPLDEKRDAPGGVEDANPDANPDQPPVELSDAEKASVVENLAKLTHKKLDALAGQRGVSWPDGKPTRREKAQLLADAGVTG